MVSSSNFYWLTRPALSFSTINHHLNKASDFDSVDLKETMLSVNPLVLIEI